MIEQRAEKLKREGLALLASPSAFILPKPVRNLIADLLALVADLAREQGREGSNDQAS